MFWPNIPLYSNPMYCIYHTLRKKSARVHPSFHAYTTHTPFDLRKQPFFRCEGTTDPPFPSLPATAVQDSKASPSLSCRVVCFLKEPCAPVFVGAKWSDKTKHAFRRNPWPYVRSGHVPESANCFPDNRHLASWKKHGMRINMAAAARLYCIAAREGETRGLKVYWNSNRPSIFDSVLGGCSWVKYRTNPCPHPSPSTYTHTLFPAAILDLKVFFFFFIFLFIDWWEMKVVLVCVCGCARVLCQILLDDKKTYHTTQTPKDFQKLELSTKFYNIQVISLAI